MQAVGYNFGQGGVVAPTLALFKSSVGALKMTDKRICSIDNCDKPFYCRGFCNFHYDRHRRGIDLYAPKKLRNGGLRAWLDANKDYQGDDCLDWPFGKLNSGHGAVAIDGGHVTSASRAMCILAHGEPPAPKMDAAHSCGNGHEGCVNPKHLRWATRTENFADMIAHGTKAFGESTSQAKLTEAQVRKIMTMKGDYSQARIGKMFGVKGSTIGRIHRKEAWQHLWEQ